jgi:hypothetical protein
MRGYPDDSWPSGEGRLSGEMIGIFCSGRKKARPDRSGRAFGV